MHNINLNHCTGHTNTASTVNYGGTGIVHYIM